MAAKKVGYPSISPMQLYDIFASRLKNLVDPKSRSILFFIKCMAHALYGEVVETDCT